MRTEFNVGPGVLARAGKRDLHTILKIQIVMLNEVKHPFRCRSSEGKGFLAAPRNDRVLRAASERVLTLSAAAVGLRQDCKATIHQEQS